MMSKNKKWMVAIGVLTTMTVSGLAMAASTAEKTDAASGKRGVEKRGFKHHKGQRPENKELLALLKMDAETFRNEMKAGKTLAEVAKERGVSEQQLKDVMIRQMTERIDAGVKAGKLTTEQADKLKADMDQRVSDRINRKAPVGDMHHGRRHHRMDNTELLALLKLDQEAFRSEMRAGKTLAEVAKERGVAEQQLKDVIIKQMTERIDAGVKAGKLTAEKADKIKANMDQRVSEQINRKGPMKGHFQHRRHMDNSELLALLKMDAETFRTEIKSGKSLADIAKERGVSEKQLKEVMIKQMTERIDASVKAGRLSEEKAAEMKSRMETHIDDMIAGKKPTHKQR